MDKQKRANYVGQLDFKFNSRTENEHVLVVLWLTKPHYSIAIVGKFQKRFSVLRSVERERERGRG